MTVTATKHILIDDRGIARIDGTRMKVVHVAEDLLANASTPEQMHAQWPDLSLAQIHAALSYYYDHKPEFDAQVEQAGSEFEKLRREAPESPGRRKLRARGKLP